MKIVIINGSARKGNTLTAINAFIKGASEKNEIEIIATRKGVGKYNLSLIVQSKDSSQERQLFICGKKTIAYKKWKQL